MNTNFKEFNDEFLKLMELFRPLIGHNDELLLHRIFSGGIEKYIDRLTSLGFSGYQHVLDAGCGYGQWSLALAEMNYKVSSCDLSQARIEFLEGLTKVLDVPNIQLSVNGIDELPYADSSFDAIFCYSVIFLTPWRHTLSEFRRVLKPGGTLYLNANGSGWYMFLWQEEHNKAKDYDPKSIVARAFIDTLRYERDQIYEPGMNLIIEPEVLKCELVRLGFSDIRADFEGGLKLNEGAPVPKPFFIGEFKGLVGVHEILARKGYD